MAEAARSAVEGIKEGSHALRGTIAREMSSGEDHFGEASKTLLKFHGTYQQEDRDARKLRGHAGPAKRHMFMVRCKIPGGKLTAEQYLALDSIAGERANGTLRLTTRQGVQFHGVLMGDLKATIAGINDCLLTTLGACGDVTRNMMACPAPLNVPARQELQRQADALAAHFAPTTGAYHEIWLDGAAVSPAGEVDPIYGALYLPRKFKMGLTLPHDNCVDVYAQDLGYLAQLDAAGQIVGYDVLVGGGMGMTHGNAKTFPHLAQPILHIQPDQVVPAAEAVVKLFRDHGNRADRKRARIKYLVHDWGVEKFREMLAPYLPFALKLPVGLHVTGVDLHLGWQSQGDSRWFYGLSIENGRIKDAGDLRLRSGLRAIMERFRPTVRLTPQQDILLCDLPGDVQSEFERLLSDHGISRPDQISPTRQLSMACPAIPTCGLAIAESERTLPGILDQLEAVLSKLGLEREAIGVRMTGCPNGCARPYQSDIGIVGRSGSKYTLYAGGGPLGDRLNKEIADLVPMGDIVTTLEPLLVAFRDGRQAGESFGAFVTRTAPSPPVCER